MSVSTFLHEYRALTDPHPMHSSIPLRLWQSKVVLHVNAYYGCVLLRRIEALNPRHGHATRCMRWLTALAAKHNVMIVGHASKPSARYAAAVPTPPIRVLQRWYRGFGARFDRHGAFTITGA